MNVQRVPLRSDSPSHASSVAPAAVHQVLRAAGQPLDAATRAFFEPRYHHDFSRVRIHADRDADASARALGAAAYTVGSQIAFARGRYRPSTGEGRRLLAHELAHVAQQRSVPDARSDVALGKRSDPAERSADAAAQRALAGTQPAVLDASETAPIVRRSSVDTWGGTFDNDLQYEATNERDGKQANYGATIQIRFTPKPVVRADKIALVQTASTTWNDTSHFVGTGAERKATEARSTPSGTHIDQVGLSSITPLVAMRNPRAPSMDLAESVPGKSTRFGIPSAKDPESRKAWVFDPAAFGPIPDEVAASQSLQTAALAVSGPQKGVYYGAVSWGWEKEANARTATLKPFARVSGDAPSAEFNLASTLWNASKTDSNDPRIALPITSGKFVARTGTALMERADGGKVLARIELNARVEITGPADVKHPDASPVIVTDGAHAGKQGWVKTSLLSDFTRKKSL
jgi:hypothetical protein